MTTYKECLAFAPQPACSGNGVCDHATGLCICSNGWTSIGDYSSIPGLSCSINIPTMRALWVIETICSIGLFLVTTKYIRIHYSFNANDGKKKFDWKDPLVIFSVNFWIESITGIILGILKVIDPEKYSIASDPFASVMFGLFYITGVHGCCAYMYVLINFISSYARLMSGEAKEYIRKEGEILKRWSIVVAILIIPVCIIPLIAIAYPGHDRETAAANLASFALIASFLIGVCVRYMGIIIRVIEKHLDENNEDQTSANKNTKNREVLMAIKTKLGKARMVMGALGPSSIVTFGTLAAWELLTRNTSYLWPLQLLATDVQFIPIVLSMMNNSNDKSDSDSTGIRQSKTIPTTGGSSPVKGARIVAVSTPLETAPRSPNSSSSPIQKIGDISQDDRVKYSSEKVAPEDLEEGGT